MVCLELEEVEVFNFCDILLLMFGLEAEDEAFKPVDGGNVEIELFQGGVTNFCWDRGSGVGDFCKVLKGKIVILVIKIVNKIVIHQESHQ